MTTYWCADAWLPAGPTSLVRVTVEGGRFTRVQTGVRPRAGDVELPGLVLPGFANAHSHAFHRALRGRAGGADFWAWREDMYALAATIGPETYYALARALYAEMALAGVTAVGEFHYLHHGVAARAASSGDGGAVVPPHAMAEALVLAAGEAGLRITLLDTCYLTGGPGRPLTGAQVRFGDADGSAWARRADGFAARVEDLPGVLVGVAIHSVRAVPVEQMPVVVAWAAGREAPLHVHVSEQRAENDECRRVYGCSPARVLAEAGALGPRTTVVHAVHVDEDDRRLIGGSGTAVALCPTTERDLGDGIAPAAALAVAGSPLCVGSDQHVVVDPLAEVQALEAHERLVSGRRGIFQPAELVAALAGSGHQALGWPQAGRIEVGAVADLVALRRDTVRTAGTAVSRLPEVASAADVAWVVSGGDVVVRDGQHVLGDAGAALELAVELVWSRARTAATPGGHP